MKVYRIIHTNHAFLPFGKDEDVRYFENIEKANLVFESLSHNLDYSNDEWISFDEVEIINKDGELREGNVQVLRYFSDDTKIGVKFYPTSH